MCMGGVASPELHIRKGVRSLYTVYMHQHKENGKRYFGITSTDVKRRWKNGFGYSENLPIGRAIRKYGWDAFSHDIIADNLSEGEAKQMEISLISEYHTQDDRFGYNICAGGEGVTGWHPSEETKRKIGEAHKGLFGDKNPNFGHKWTDEMKNAASKRKRGNCKDSTRMKMSESAKKRTGELNSFFGKHHSDETKKKISESQSRPVDMFDKSMTLLRTFPSIISAAMETGINKVAISNCCRGVTHTSGGYIWKYAEL